MIKDTVVSSEASEIINNYFTKHYDSLLRFARASLTDNADVAVHETYIIVTKIPAKFLKSEKPVGFLFEVLKNVIKHLRRDEQNVIKHCVPMSNNNDFVHTDSYSIDLMLRENGDDESHDFKMLVLFHVMGYSLKDLSNEYNISIGYCKKRLRLARAYYRQRFHNLYK